MSLPPEHITIKRRRDDDPVDFLYIQKEQQHKKRRFTDFVFRRITENEGHNRGTSAQALVSQRTNRQTQRTSSGYPLPQVPTVRASLPGEEDQVKQHTRSTARAVENVPDPSSLVQQTPESDDTLPASSTPAVEPRRFHLTKSASSLSLRHQTPSSAIQKHKKSRRDDLAVFVEKSKDKSRPKTPRGNSAVSSQRQSRKTGDSMPPSAAVQLEEGRPRKRPNVSAAERKWRAEHSGDRTLTRAPKEVPARIGRTIHDPPNTWDYNSIELAEQLHQVALQESGCTNGTSVAAGSVLSSPNAKIKPKAPPPRYDERQPQTHVDVADATEAEHDVEDDKDYVYDTYVRQVAPSSKVVPTSSMDHSEELDSGKIAGILVINQEDQEVWESYGVDDESDKDWNSEEEDENAEDYYANDYPEDEVTSDDERDMGAYEHRRGASDAEEYDEDTAAWSDDDDS
ncbi:MAG: hypothetical protein FRX48_02063 [Lasallia pustulata]|uniref:Transcription factor Iwr1 domain-containing protein n=1 Tax=Lasallia pustulata TaxID=136370 RepID=A0A5M8PXM6_9LECA|nr:MAG: hypothetical protein FRX48_02063 [Lasallia pustulata]